MPINRFRFRWPFLGVFVVVGIHTSTANAQSAVMTASGGPALVKTLSDRDSAWQIGWGAERLNGPVGWGGDIDYVYFPPHTDALSGGHGTATKPSLNMAAATMKATYHFGQNGTRSRARPFVAGGLSFLFSEGEYGMILVSGGVDWWTSRRAGIRVEVRGQFPIMLGVRAGLVLR